MQTTGQININSADVESAISMINSAKTSLEGEAKASVTNGFTALESVGLFSGGLSQIKANVDKVIASLSSFSSALSSHLSSIKAQEDQNDNYIRSYSNGGGSSGYNSSNASSTYSDADTNEVDKGNKISDTELATFIAEMEVDTAKTLLESLEKQAEEYGTTITELLLNPEKSGLLVEILKKLCGDSNGNIDTTSTNITNLIQKILLTKLVGYDDDAFASLKSSNLLSSMKYLSEFAKENDLSLHELVYDEKNAGLLIVGIKKLYDGVELDNYKPTTAEVNSTKEFIDAVAKKNNTTADELLSSSKNKDEIIETTETKIIKQSENENNNSSGENSSGENSNSEGNNNNNNNNNGGGAAAAPVDVSNLPAVGEHTSSWQTLGETWVVCTTAASVPSYSSYCNGRIAQNVDTSKFGDKCLSFAETHAYAMYTGNTGDTAERASNYPHSGAFTSWFSDSLEETLQMVYSQIVSGKPVVIQVNGNKQGTSRHFVTVVGFKSSVTEANKLTAQDLLIIDSWDGQTERMDQSNSRFLTTGAACHKNYTGYYLRILK